MKKIIILMPYFGKWPPWFELFMQTCVYNPTVSWIFFTDADRPAEKCQNVDFVGMDLKQFNSLCSEKLGLQVQKRAYSLCDLRPAYGKIFSDHINGFDFWGHSDIDVFYGNIRAFFTEEILNKYDIISSRNGMLSGHFTIYKNVEEINALFRKLPNHEILFTDKRYLLVDEIIMSDLIRHNRMKGVYWQKEMVADRRKIEALPRGWYWARGGIYNTRENDKEYMYIHLKSWKPTMKKIEVKRPNYLDEWVITKKGVFYPRKQLLKSKSARKIYRRLSTLTIEALRYAARKVKKVEILRQFLDILDVMSRIRPVPWYAGINANRSNGLYLGICATFKNRAPHLKEWIEFHRMLGAERLYLYNSQSADDFMSVLRPYIRKRIVRLYDIKNPSGRAAAYSHCLKNHRKEARWIAFIDIDEFLFPAHESCLPDALRDYERFPAVGVHTILYGSSGHAKRPEGLTIENYTRRSEIDFPENEYIKSIVNPRMTISWSANAHHGIYADNAGAVDENMHLIEERFFIDFSNRGGFGVFTKSPVSVARLRVNNYCLRSLEEYKARRGKGNKVKRDINRFYRYDKYCNKTEDVILKRFVPELKTRLMDPS
ncbi:MAG: hypothetical protein A2Z72_01380 [Omnitrophica bacterium RBG_13_46_9]|nr:MAG: hypothetical protein A2Z72_01380 [Omnitrophica bacterium RBG_13_46_9]